MRRHYDIVPPNITVVTNMPNSVNQFTEVPFRVVFSKYVRGTVIADDFEVENGNITLFEEVCDL